MEQVMDMLMNNMLLRGLLGAVGMLLLTKQAGFVKKAVPVILLAVNIILEVVKVMFPGLVTPAQAAEMVGAVAAHAPWWKHWLLVVGSTAVAIGMHSGPKNAREWADLGFELFDKSQRR